VNVYEPAASELVRVKSRISADSWQRRVEQAQRDEPVLRAILDKVAGGLSLNDAIAKVLRTFDVAATIAHSARNRHESRGAHSRRDFPQRDDANYLKHTLAFRTDGPPRIDYVPVTITKWEPVERKY